MPFLTGSAALTPQPLFSVRNTSTRGDCSSWKGLQHSHAVIACEAEALGGMHTRSAVVFQYLQLALPGLALLCCWYLRNVRCQSEMLKTVFCTFVSADAGCQTRLWSIRSLLTCCCMLCHKGTAWHHSGCMTACSGTPPHKLSTSRALPLFHPQC